MKQNYEYVDVETIPSNAIHKTSVDVNTKNFFKVQKKLGSEQKTFKDFVNEKLIEEVERQ